MHVGGVSAPLTVQSTREPDTRCKKKSLPRMDWNIEFVLVNIRSDSWFVTEGRDMIVITLHVFAVVRDTA